MVENGTAPAVAVPSGLDDKRVVSLIEGASFDQHIARHLDVDAVVVAVPRHDIDITDDRALAKEEMDRPERRVANADILETDVAAAVELDEMRPRAGILLVRNAAALDRDALRSPLL